MIKNGEWHKKFLQPTSNSGVWYVVPMMFTLILLCITNPSCVRKRKRRKLSIFHLSKSFYQELILFLIFPELAPKSQQLMIMLKFIHLFID